MWLRMLLPEPYTVRFTPDGEEGSIDPRRRVISLNPRQEREHLKRWREVAPALRPWYGRLLGLTQEQYEWAAARGHGGYLELRGSRRLRGGYGLYLADCLDHTDSVMLTEGEIKAMVAWREAALSMPAVAKPGAGDWHAAYANLLRAKTVYLAYDSDRAGQAASRRDGERLQGVAAAVKVIRWPEVGDKIDLDGFILSHGTKAMQRLIDQAETM